MMRRLTGTPSTARSRIDTTTRRRKGLAILAAGTVIGVGTFGTLASWTDSEWVFGGADSGGEKGVGTSSFNVWQARSTPAPAINAATGWEDQETDPGGALVFNIDPSKLTPGDVMYAPVALQTKANSVAGTLTLQTAKAAAGKTAVDTGNLLWGALHYQVNVSSSSAAACTAAGWSGAGWTSLVGDTAGLGTAITASPQALAANRGDAKYFCFRIELPAGSPSTLQGRTVYPAWQFAATSS